MAKHMFILEAHSWSFLSIFETKSNLSDAYKKVYVVFVIRLFRGRKNSHWEKKTSSLRQFYMLSFSHKQISFPNEENFYSKWAKIYSHWTLLESQRISVNLKFLLLWQVNFYPKQVNSCLFWAFFLS